jgi:GntR family transcriptional regulator
MDDAKYRTIAGKIRRHIIDGSYPPGSLIPSETALIVEYGCSRPTVQKALDILKAEGWITSEHGKGRYVSQPVSVLWSQAAKEIAARIVDLELDILAAQAMETPILPGARRVAGLGL